AWIGPGHVIEHLAKGSSRCDNRRPLRLRHQIPPNKSHWHSGGRRQPPDRLRIDARHDQWFVRGIAMYERRCRLSYRPTPARRHPHKAKRADETDDCWTADHRLLVSLCEQRSKSLAAGSAPLISLKH